MMVFGFSSILFYLEYRKKIGTKYQGWIFAISTLCAGITLSIKWTGLTFLFLIIVMELVRLLYEKVEIKSFFKQSSIFILKYLLISTIIYVSLFAIHFSVLKNSGQGDAFMSLEFKKDLIGSVEYQNPSIRSLNFFQKFTELNRVMFTSSSGMKATHSYSSKWYTWPIMQRSVFYWQDNSPKIPGERAYIYLLGNPFIYWFGTLSVLILIIVTIYNLLFKKYIAKDSTRTKIVIFLIIGFLANFLPYMLIGRVMFLYHYETALIFSIISIVFWLNYLQGKKLLYASIIISIIALSFFLYFSPITYGIPITDKQLNSRMWLSSWR
jgi:dolichyl-phosphate-mannose-protein mannosyltransferase